MAEDPRKKPKEYAVVTAPPREMPQAEPTPPPEQPSPVDEMLEVTPPESAPGTVPVAPEDMSQSQALYNLALDNGGGGGGGGPRTKQVTTSVQYAQPSTPEQQQEMAIAKEQQDIGTAAQMMAPTALDEALAKRDAEIAEAEKQGVLEQKKLEAQRAEEIKSDNITLDSARKKITTQQQAVDKLAKEQGAEYFWKQRGTFAQVLAALGSAMGAFGASMNKTRNFAQDTIDAAIDREIQTQRDALETGKQNLSTAKGVYADALRAWGDRDQAYLAARASIREDVAKRAERIADAYKIRRDDIVFKNTWGQNIEKAGMDREQAVQLEAGKTEVTQTAVSGGGGGGSEGKLRAMERSQNIIMKNLQIKKMEKELSNGDTVRQYEVNGVGKFKNEKEAKEVADALEAYGSVVGAVKYMEKLSKDSSAIARGTRAMVPDIVAGAVGDTVSAAHKAGTDAQTDLTFRLGRLSGQSGASLSGKEAERFTSMAQHPYSVKNPRAGYNRILAGARGGLARMEKQYGLRPGTLLRQGEDMAKITYGEYEKDHPVAGIDGAEKY